jgi:uncharacterized iron-regulated membrane protein
MRKVLFWIHLTAGVLAGTVVLVMSVTGALLAFEPQILRLLEEPGAVAAPDAADRQRLGPEALLARALEARPGSRPITITYDAAPSAPVVIGLGREAVVFVDPHSGDVLGDGSRGARRFFRAVTDWHRWLGAEGESRATARAVTGACNAAFLFLSVSGLYLWWPRRWSWRTVRPIVGFQGGLSGKARDFNWHNVIGVWSAPVLFFLTLTALTISYPAVGNLLYTNTPPGGAERTGGARGRADGPPRSEAGRTRGSEEPFSPATLTGLDRAWERAQSQVPGWTLVALRLPSRLGAPVSMSISDADSRSPYGRSQLSVDPRTGETLKWEPFAGFGSGRKLRTAARWTHTGEILGWPGQLAAGLASLGGSVLVWTGLSLAWRRFRAWRAAPSPTRQPASATTAETVG